MRDRVAHVCVDPERKMGVFSSAATVFFLCGCGTGLTLYAVHVQRSRLDDTGYRALCDVDEVITCSEIVAEEYVFESKFHVLIPRRHVGCI